MPTLQLLSLNNESCHRTDSTVLLIVWLLRCPLIVDARSQSGRLSKAGRPTGCPTHTSWDMGTRLASSSDSFFTLTDPAGRVFLKKSEIRWVISSVRPPAILVPTTSRGLVFACFIYFWVTKVPIVCIMFLSPWVSPLPPPRFLWLPCASHNFLTLYYVHSIQDTIVSALYSHRPRLSASQPAPAIFLSLLFLNRTINLFFSFLICLLC